MKKFLFPLLLAFALLLPVWGIFGNSSAEQQTLAEKQARTGQQPASTNKNYAEPLQAEWKLYINEQMQASLEKLDAHASSATTTLGVLAAILFGFMIFNYLEFNTKVKDLEGKLGKAEKKLQIIEQVSKEVEIKLSQATEKTTEIEQVRQNTTNLANEFIKRVEEDAKALKQKMETHESQAEQCLGGIKKIQSEMSTITSGSVHRDLADKSTGSYSPDLHAKAEAGDPEAQFNLGLAYAFGDNGVKQDLFEAAKWIKQAAEQDYTKAFFQLGSMYYLGKGLLINKADAAKWWKKAAEQGDAKAQLNLGRMLFNGDGIAENKAEAEKWLRKAVDQGNDNAQFSLGYMLLNGDGISKNKTEAAKWFRKAADQGNAEAQFSLGLMLFKGDGIAKNKEEAAKWFRKVAEQEQGNADAQFNLGLMLYDGDGIAENKEEAAKWFREAAERGVAVAQCNLGAMLYKGEGIPKNEEKGLEWFRKAADNGHIEAQRFLEKIKKAAKDESTGLDKPSPEKESDQSKEERDKTKVTNADNPKTKK